MLYLVAGLFSSSWFILLILLSVLFPVIIANARWAAKIQIKTEYSVVKIAIVFLSFVGGDVARIEIVGFGNIFSER